MFKPGIFAALVTPFTKSGDVDYKEAKKLVRHLLNQGIDGFYVCGSTGEAFMLSMEERKKLIEAVVEENNGEKSVVCHCGAISSNDVSELAKHATSSGVDAVSAIPPFYYKFEESEIVDHYKILSDSTPLPVIIYNFPEFSGVKFTLELFDTLFSLNKNIVSIKHTSFDLYMLERLKQRYPNSIIFNGRDEILLSGLVAGADGAIGSTYNAIPKVFKKISDCYSQGKILEAQKAQHFANDFVDLLGKYGTMQVIKEFIENYGIECNGVKKPFKSIDDQGKTFVKAMFNRYEQHDY